jgi:sugar (pentulose or hexulose) kinase
MPGDFRMFGDDRSIRMSFCMGNDTSTTGAKTLPVDKEGQVLSSAVFKLSHSTLRPLWSEQIQRDAILRMLLVSDA